MARVQNTYGADPAEPFDADKDGNHPTMEPVKSGKWMQADGTMQECGERQKEEKCDVTTPSPIVIEERNNRDSMMLHHKGLEFS
jgi:hypothetical protein